MRVAVAGLAAGAGLAWPLSRGLGSLTVGVTAANPIVWGVVLAAIGASNLLAGWRPAAQAMRADPVVLLRAK